MSAGTANPATWPMWRGPLAYGHAGAMKIVFDGREESIALHHTSRFLGDSGRPQGLPPPSEYDREQGAHEGERREDEDGQRQAVVPPQALTWRRRQRALGVCADHAEGRRPHHVRRQSRVAWRDRSGG